MLKGLGQRLQFRQKVEDLSFDVLVFGYGACQLLYLCKQVMVEIVFDPSDEEMFA